MEADTSRLSKDIRRLRDLISRLESASTLEEKDAEVSSDRRVRSVFGDGSSRTFRKPSVTLALSILSPAQLYVLKCMVACGQEHLLETPVEWQETVLHSRGVYGSDSCVGPCSSEDQGAGSSLKEAFGTLASMIEGWDGGDSSKSVFSGLMEGWNSPGVFPSQIMEVVDWEGRKVREVRSSMSFVKGLLHGWDTPGVFPSQVIELFDFEGVYSKTPPPRQKPLEPPSLQALPARDCEYDDGAAVRSSSLRGSLLELVDMLVRMEKFYDSVGGILGYQLVALELIEAAEAEKGSSQSRMDAGAPHGSISRPEPRFGVPLGRDLARDKVYATQAAFWGLQGLPTMGEVYPLGGSGDRLGLVDERTGECLPVAMLPYCGRTLLEGLLRDLQAREYLHFRVFGEQHVTPVAIMTSPAKQNSRRVRALCESHGWFGRGRANFRLFEQPLVPAIGSEDGRWPATEPLKAVLKPGGHGVIWKLACDEGIFSWFYSLGRKAAMLRQISNPLAATDVTMLALAGAGLQGNKKFGFVSCERNIGHAEGVNVLAETRHPDGTWEYGVTCVEYTEFEKLSIADVPVAPGSLQSQYPANTNVLFVDLATVEAVASSPGRAALPGMIMNLKKPIKYADYAGRMHSVRGGRMECTMQNIADSLGQTFPERLPLQKQEDLDTFLLYNERRKVTSSAKRRRNPGDLSLHQTPDGSFLDLNRNSSELLASCGVNIPRMEDNQCYLETGPPYIAVLHPALGPLWDVVRQKIRGGSFSLGSELKLEIAELAWRDVEVDGSLLVEAENALGEYVEEGGERILRFGQRCGRCRLQRVRVVNRGVEWGAPGTVCWQHSVRRREALRVTLCGDAEFDAADVTFEGNHEFTVPSGHRMRVTSAGSGLSCELEPLHGPGAAASPSWEWRFGAEAGGKLHLAMLEHRVDADERFRWKD